MSGLVGLVGGQLLTFNHPGWYLATTSRPAGSVVRDRLQAALERLEVEARGATCLRRDHPFEHPVAERQVDPQRPAQDGRGPVRREHRVDADLDPLAVAGLQRQPLVRLEDRDLAVERGRPVRRRAGRSARGCRAPAGPGPAARSRRRRWRSAIAGSARARSARRTRRPVDLPIRVSSSALIVMPPPAGRGTPGRGRASRRACRSAGCAPGSPGRTPDRRAPRRPPATTARPTVTTQRGSASRLSAQCAPGRAATRIVPSRSSTNPIVTTRGSPVTRPRVSSRA